MKFKDSTKSRLNWILCFILIIVLVICMIYFYNKSEKVEDEEVISTGEIEDLKNWEDSDGTIYKNLEYTDGLSYDLYIPTNLYFNISQPVMLFLHGGSWDSGSKEEMDYFCKFFTKAGYITATMNYSLVNDNGTVTFLDMLDEIEQALLAIKEKGEELGITIDECAISGYSAGGHLALLYSYSRAETSPIEIKFVFEESGPTDFHRDSWTQYDDEFVANSLFKYSGVQVSVNDLETEEVEEVINLLSPLYYVDENTIPTILAYGTLDTLVMPVHYKKLKSALEEYGVKYDLLEFEGASHVLYTNTTMQDKYYAKVLKYAEEMF